MRELAHHHLKAKRLEIKTASHNSASIRVALRRGFQFEAKLLNNRIDHQGNIGDTCIYTYNH